jgi:hypothetical protein
MSDELLPPLSDEAAALLDVERLCPGPTAAIRARILERVAAAALFVPPTSPGATPATATPAAATASGAGLLIKAGLIFIVGVGAGVGGTLAVQHARPAVPARSQRASSAADPAPAVTVPVAPRVAAPEAVAAPPSRASGNGNGMHKRVRPVVVAVEPVATAESLAAERRLVEMARTALGRTRPGQALEALAQHRRRFPRGQLAEERDALTVLALIASSEGERAQDQAQRFRDRYPKSLLLPAIEAALAEEKRRGE